MADKMTDQELTVKAGEFIRSIVGEPPKREDFPNAYEYAAEQFNRASEWARTLYKLGTRIGELAEEEYSNRQLDLRQYESQPGIPLPEYRESRLRM